MLIVLDYETNGLETWRSDFLVHSASFTWKVGTEYKSKFVKGHDEVGQYVERLNKSGHHIVVFNCQFEMAVTKSCYGMDLNVYSDVQRLVQQWGGVSKKDEKRSAYGLESSVERILGIRAYKQKYYEWIKANVPAAAKGKPGAFIDQLPDDLLEAYNHEDTIYTHKLFEHITAKFSEEDFDWTVDHEMYLKIARLVAYAKIKGVAVNREHLHKYIQEIDVEVAALDAKFTKKFEPEIQSLLQDKYQARLSAYKSERGRASMTWEKFLASKEGRFNPGSTTQLAELFVGKLGKKPKFFTDKGKPSFKAAHLNSWGDGGAVLEKRSKRLKVKTFSETLLEKAAIDGRYHHDLRVCGTSTFRMAGGGGLNVQGLGRRDKGLMSSIVADPGRVFVSVDLGSGEPTVTSYYSKDANYRYAVFDGVGKEPYWKNGVLYIDDPYITGMSLCPFLLPVIRSAWKADYDGLTFAQQWLKDPEVIQKKRLKKERQLAKRWVLGLNYSMGIKKLHKIAIEENFDIEEKDCKDFYDGFWGHFRAIKKFARKIGKVVEKQGYFVNEFGLRLTPEPHKAYNAFIQSSINPIINIFTLNALELAPWADYVVIIHDETIFDIPEDRVEEFKVVCQKATDMLNETLGWDLKIRTGFAPGKDWYEAK